MQTVVVEETGVNWIGIIFFFIIILIILILIGFAIWEVFTAEGTRRLGESCIPGTCVPGLICDKGLCRQPLRSQCDNLSDCISTATACFNHICVDTQLSDAGGKAPCKAGLINERGTCKAPVNGECTKDYECIHNTYCYDKKCKKYDDSSDSESSSSSESSESSHDCSIESSDDSSRNQKSSNHHKSPKHHKSPRRHDSSRNQESSSSNYVSQSSSDKSPRGKPMSSSSSIFFSSPKGSSRNQNSSNNQKESTGNHNSSNNQKDSSISSIYSKMWRSYQNYNL